MRSAANAKAVLVEIDERDGRLCGGPGGLVEEVAGADADVEVTGGDVAIVEPAQFGSRAAPEQAIGKPEHEPVIHPQHERE